MNDTIHMEAIRSVRPDGGRTKYFKGEKVGDCVARAIVNTTGMDYKKDNNEIFYFARPRGIKKTARTIKIRNNASPRKRADKKVPKHYIENFLGFTWI